MSDKKKIVNLTVEIREDLNKTVDFRSKLMKLMYVAIRTRPDILFHIVTLSSRMSKPKSGDDIRLDKVLRYLYDTQSHGIIFRSHGKIHLECYVDAAFNIHPDARVHTGYCILPDRETPSGRSGAVVARSLKQKSVANSSTEAELIALHEAVLHLSWIIDLYEDMGISEIKPVKVHQDNRAAILLSSNEPLMFKGPSKYINRKYFSVYEHITDGKVILAYCGTESMIADFLTKSLMGNKFRRFAISLMGSVEASA